MVQSTSDSWECFITEEAREPEGIEFRTARSGQFVPQLLDLRTESDMMD